MSHLGSWRKRGQLAEHATKCAYPPSVRTTCGFDAGGGGGGTRVTMRIPRNHRRAE